MWEYNFQASGAKLQKWQKLLAKERGAIHERLAMKGKREAMEEKGRKSSNEKYSRTCWWKETSKIQQKNSELKEKPETDEGAIQFLKFCSTLAAFGEPSSLAKKN